MGRTEEKQGSTPKTSLEKYAMKLEMTPNLEESDHKEGAGTAGGGQLQSKQPSEAADCGELTCEMGRTEEKQGSTPKTSLEKYAMKLEMTPNLEESDIKKEQVLQAEDTFNLNNHQKLQSAEELN